MAAAEDVGTGFTLLQLIMAASGSSVLVAAANAWWTRKQRSADPAKALTSGSIEWATAVRADNVEIRKENADIKKELDELREDYKTMLRVFRAHHRWDLMAAAKIRELDPHTDFPDPPLLEDVA